MLSNNFSFANGLLISTIAFNKQYACTSSSTDGCLELDFENRLNLSIFYRIAVYGSKTVVQMNAISQSEYGQEHLDMTPHDNPFSSFNRCTQVLVTVCENTIPFYVEKLLHDMQDTSGRKPIILSPHQSWALDKGERVYHSLCHTQVYEDHQGNRFCIDPNCPNSATSIPVLECLTKKPQERVVLNVR